MTSLRDLENRVTDLEDGSPDDLDLEDAYEWIKVLSEHGAEAPRPPEYFPAGAEWAESVQEQHEKLADRAPELRHLSPPEAYVLSFMDEETTTDLLDLLATSSDPAVEQWHDAVMQRVGEQS